MNLDLLLNSLRYDTSPNFLVGKALGSDRDFGHIFRKAEDECNLRGAYVLNAAPYDKSRSNVPVVYVCEARSDAEAREIHRKVWNQNAVPFLLVASNTSVRLYPGFQYDREAGNSPLQGALAAIDDFNQISRLLPIGADSVDAGRVWREFGKSVVPEKRVDWQLLASLRELDRLLRQGLARPKLAHAMIGKFVYIHYLRQRDILSNRRLSEWDIDPDHIFGHSAQLESFLRLVDRLDDYLNGSVFPLSSTSIREFGAARLRKVASVFKGEQPGSGQLPLFDLYDFSFIPIETLSVIYEQFLHDTDNPSGRSEGEERAAYYTPLSVVNFMLDKLESRKPLVRGMRVLDPSCGSGAFLVQCYRKLIERRRHELGRRLSPAELGRLLTNHIFGVDIDEDACQIAELSLALTLLEYVNPPDLTETSFKLPSLRDRNIHCANAFDDEAQWYRDARTSPFDWIVGNPPWKPLEPTKLDQADRCAWEWMQQSRASHPVGGNQLAEAFAWRVTDVLAPEGEATLLLPAMTLFKYESTSFRRTFLSQHRLWSIANFANLADVLFGHRATLPAAAFFFSASAAEEGERDDGLIEVYSPLVANQVDRSHGSRRRNETWNIVVNSSDLRDVAVRDVLNGDPLPWKIAMWGSMIDKRVLTDANRRYRTIGQLEEDGRLIVSQGLELRLNGTGEKIEQHDELSGQLTLDVNPLKNRRYLFRFPEKSLIEIPADNTGVRAGRFKVPFRVCQPPHVIVGASRNFAVYTEKFLVVPARQIGIASPDSDRNFLKAIALYLSSDFVAYHQFLTTTQAGIQKSINTLKTLRALPLPFRPGEDLSDWSALYARLEREVKGGDNFDRPDLVEALNELTFNGLKLSAQARAAVHDLVKVRFALKRGKVGEAAVRRPIRQELEAYAQMLGNELDGFIGRDGSVRHNVSILFGGESGLVAIDLITDIPEQVVRTPTGKRPRVVGAIDAATAQLEEARSNLVQQRSQWLYFNRNLKVYDGLRTYILKPLQRLHWTETQAIQDASDIISESLQPRQHEPSEVAN